MLRFIAPLVVVSLCLGCQDKADPKSPVPRAKAVAQTDPAVLKRLDALGDGGLLVGVLDARGWAKVHHRLTPVIANLPGGAPPDLASAATLPGLLNSLYIGLFGGNAPLDLSAMDAKGTVVVSLFEPATFGPPGAAAALLRFDNKTVPMRHEIVLPATDASALAASVLAGLKVACKPAAHGCDFGVLQVGVKAEGDVVRIAALMPATVEDAATMLWTTAQPASVRTPAYTQLAMPGAGLGLLIRPWRVRAMFAQQGANEITTALLGFGGTPDVQQSLFANGASMVLGAVQLMHAERPDFEDAVVRLVADDAGIALEGTHGLTAATAKVLKAAIDKGGRILALKISVLAQMAERVDLNALLDGVGPRPIFAKMKRMRDFTRAHGECGFGCVLHTTLRVPFGSARGLLDMAPTEVKSIVRALPTAMQGVLVRLDERGEPVVALAGDVASDFDTGQLRALPGAEIHLIPKDNRAVLLVGIGIDPRTVFDIQAPTTHATTSRARVEPAALEKIARLLRIGSITPVFKALGPIVADSALAPGGHAFAWRVHLSTSPGVTTSAFAPAATTPFKGPILGYTPGEGDRCLRDSLIGTSKAFEALANVAPDERGALFIKAFAEGAPNLKCAESHASTMPAALGMRRLFVHLIGIAARPDQTEILAFIDAQCATTKDAWICSEAKRIKDLPPPPPPPNPLAEPPSGPGVDTPLLGLFNDKPGDPVFKLTKADLEGALDPVKPIKPVETRDKRMIQKVIRSNIKQARYCYEKSLAKNPQLAGKAMVSFIIQPDGSVAAAASKGSDLPAEVHACLVRVSERWRFPPALKVTKVSYPFIFKSE